MRSNENVMMCHWCGEIYPIGYKHVCRMKQRDTPFATIVDSKLPMLDEVTGRIVCRFKAEVVDMENKAIVDAVIRAAQEDGITTLYMLDKDFILSAIREKLMRDGGAYR